MAFTVYGPGVRDIVTLDNLFQQRVVEAAEPGRAVRRVADRQSQAGAERQAPQTPRSRGERAQQAYGESVETPAERQRALFAHQIMTTPVVTLSPETTIVEAWREFRERRFRHIPVVDPRRRVVGIISDRDLLRYAAISGRVPPYDEDSPEADTTIEGMMKKRVLTASPDTEIREIARVLFEQRVGAMPVVDDNGHPVGIITRSDILRTLVNHAPLELWV